MTNTSEKYERTQQGNLLMQTKQTMQTMQNMQNIFVIRGGQVGLGGPLCQDGVWCR